MIRLAILCLSLALCGCTASVSTFSADFSAPSAGESEAGATCAAEMRGRAATGSVTIGPGGGADVTRERMNLCLQRHGA